METLIVNIRVNKTDVGGAEKNPKSIISAAILKAITDAGYLAESVEVLQYNAFASPAS